jgi:hypothetical protein
MTAGPSAGFAGERARPDMRYVWRGEWLHARVDNDVDRFVHIPDFKTVDAGPGLLPRALGRNLLFKRESKDSLSPTSARCTELTWPAASAW